MSRYPGWRQFTQTSLPKARPLQKLGTERPRWSSVEPTDTGYRFVWVGYLPRISGHQVNRFARSRLCKLARVTFGVLPPALYPTRRARVEILRVLGPGQKPMDDDSIALLTGGLRDALKPCYIKDDSQRWARFWYANDRDRRAYGPCIVMTLCYLNE